MEPDRPDALASLWQAFNAYEAALIDRDLDALAAWFDDGDDVVRFGIGDRQRGASELARWRAQQPPLPVGRALSDTVLRTWGDSFGVATTCFHYPERPMLGRQSQTWVRRGGKWLIVSAHVSEVPQ